MNDKVRNIDDFVKRAVSDDGMRRKTKMTSGGDGGDNDDMLKRIIHLEELSEKTSDRLTSIERDIAVIKAESVHYATKTDIASLTAELHKAINTQTWKLIGGVGVIAAALYFLTLHAAG